MIGVIHQRSEPLRFLSRSWIFVVFLQAFFIKPGYAQDSNSASPLSNPLCWVSSSKSEETILVLRPDGHGQYLSFSKDKSGALSDSRISFVQWGIYPSGEKNAVLFGFVPPTSDFKAVRNIWVSAKKYRFDYVEGRDLLYEVDKTGIQRRFKKVKVIDE